MQRFYRATLRVSAVFAVVLFRPSVYPSVRPSVTLVYCIQKAQDIVKHLSRLGSPITLVFFRIAAPMPNSKLKPVILGQITRGGKLCDYRLKSQFISEMVRDRSTVAMER